ncbi:MAG: hypothetical protein WC797_00140 [Candidatus Paceibacterota bacterium]
MELRLASGEKVFHRFGEQRHIHNISHVLLAKALSTIRSNGEKFISTEVNFGRVIGKTNKVETGPDDEVIYAKRFGRRGHTRFVKNRKPEPCKTMAIVLARRPHRTSYTIITAFIGHLGGGEPWDKHASSSSRAHWECHALVWGCEPTVPGTETTECPWDQEITG